jgi:hypothetical protein
LDKALSLSATEIADLRALAGQLKGNEVVPILGAGASYDCGMRLAGQIAVDLHADCCLDQEVSDAMEGVEPGDLGRVAEAIFIARGEDQQAVLNAVGLPDHEKWPGTAEVDEHFCVLRVLARAVREQEGWKRAFGFNYDCCGEAALEAEGFRLNRRTRPGRLWLDHADVICSKHQYEDPTIRNGFELLKAHGCAEHYRSEYAADRSLTVAESVIIRASQVASWNGRDWARVAFSDRVRTGVLVLIGFSGQDPATAVELKRVLEDIHKGESPSTRPRLVVIDRDPKAETLQELISYGVGPEVGMSASVTEVSTAAASTTAVLLVLLAEMVALEIESALTECGFALPADIDGRLALLTLAGPPMAAWTFMLNDAVRSLGLQQVNAAMANSPPYVPLRHDPKALVRAFMTREDLYASLGMEGPGRSRELCDTEGFIVKGGQAFMPTGLDLNTLAASCKNGALDEATDVLHCPSGVSPVLVCKEDEALRGLSIESRQVVEVP